MGNQQRSPEKGNAQRLNDLFKTGERITSAWLSVMVDYLLNVKLYTGQTNVPSVILSIIGI